MPGKYRDTPPALPEKPLDTPPPVPERSLDTPPALVPESDHRNSQLGSPLFREEVFAQKQTQWLGRVLLTPPLSHTLFTWFAVLSALAVLGLLFFGSYARTERVSGWLVPEQGLVQIYSPRAGIVTQLDVEDGGLISQGNSLLSISSELQTEAVGATQEEIVRRLGQRLDRLKQERALQEQLYEQKINGSSDLLAIQTEERSKREQELQAQEQLVTLTKENSNQLKSASDQGVVAGQRWLEVEGNRLDQLKALRALERDLVVFDRERINLKAEIKALPLEKDKELSVIDRRIDELAQELAEAEARRQIVVSSPQAGTITSMQVKLGSSVTPDLPMLSIIPKGSDLEAQLFVPTRAIGFIRPGQQVLLRYRAFPYQKFGHYDGTITSVSRSTLAPSELAPQSRSVSDQANEPVYSIKVKLAQQNATAYGEAIELQPGMQLDADVYIERRRLIEWVLDPLYTLTGLAKG